MRRRYHMYATLFPMSLILSPFSIFAQEAVPIHPKPPHPALPTSTKPTSSPKFHYHLSEDTYRVSSDRKSADHIVVLTFDDGPSGSSTQKLLTVLDRHHAKAIWFVNGNQIASKKQDGTFTIHKNKADLLLEIKNRGHVIGNHTWQHENLSKLPSDKQVEEIISTNQLIEEITGEKPRYFRPPYGATTSISKKTATELGMHTINWTVGSLDWEPKVYRHPDQMQRQVLGTIHNGATILFHDRTWTADQLDKLLTMLEQNHYQFVIPTD